MLLWEQDFKMLHSTLIVILLLRHILINSLRVIRVVFNQGEMFLVLELLSTLVRVSIQAQITMFNKTTSMSTEIRTALQFNTHSTPVTYSEQSHQAFHTPMVNTTYHITIMLLREANIQATYPNNGQTQVAWIAHTPNQ